MDKKFCVSTDEGAVEFDDLNEAIEYFKLLGSEAKMITDENNKILYGENDTIIMFSDVGGHLRENILN